MEQTVEPSTDIEEDPDSQDFQQEEEWIILTETTEPALQNDLTNIRQIFDDSDSDDYEIVRAPRRKEAENIR